MPANRQLGSRGLVTQRTHLPQSPLRLSLTQSNVKHNLIVTEIRRQDSMGIHLGTKLRADRTLLGVGRNLALDKW